MYYVFYHSDIVGFVTVVKEFNSNSVSSKLYNTRTNQQIELGYIKSAFLASAQ